MQNLQLPIEYKPLISFAAYFNYCRHLLEDDKCRLARRDTDTSSSSLASEITEFEFVVDVEPAYGQQARNNDCKGASVFRHQSEMSLLPLTLQAGDDFQNPLLVSRSAFGDVM